MVRSFWISRCLTSKLLGVIGSLNTNVSCSDRRSSENFWATGEVTSGRTEPAGLSETAVALLPAMSGTKPFENDR